MKKYEWLVKRYLRSVDSLKLWAENPRLNPDGKYLNLLDYVEELLSDNSEKESFVKLLTSISEKGFIPSDPIVVWRNEDDTHCYVAEGNRRVLALKILRNPKKAPKSIRPLVKQLSSNTNLDDIQKITPFDLPGFKRLLGDGSQFGVKFEYAEQPSPDGLAQAFIIGEKFIGNDSACLVLGDNIFYGAGLNQMLHQAVVDAEQNDKATVFGYRVSDPERYGVAEFDEQGNCLSIEEKPEHPKSNYAVVGLYFYPNKVVEVAKHIKPSARGELEITTVNQEFLKDKQLKVQTMARGFAWLDTGTHDSLSEASTFIEVLEKRQGLKVACLEGIAYRQGWITAEQLRENAQPMLKNDYGKYLLSILEEKNQTLKKNLEY